MRDRKIGTDDRTSSTVALAFGNCPIRLVRTSQAQRVDYTNNRTVFAKGSIAKPTTLEVTESSVRPLPSREEFDEAVSTLKEHPELGPPVESLTDAIAFSLARYSGNSPASPEVE